MSSTSSRFQLPRSTVSSIWVVRFSDYPLPVDSERRLFELVDKRAAFVMNGLKPLPSLDILARICGTRNRNV
ncbi:unnamed protein product [Nesidiocoris tenuis]|uniref:Uncharacterized protein n=1 Tax=Nesidiocoris tenuis TaxID=355587 RepID=A0A6H5G335_9HEMI|nr:unnamed protein product [Nesidiocoris tenuis]